MSSTIPPPPTYRIFRDKHGIPQFEPKRGTQLLKDALIYAFPTLETELQLMQAALRKFFDSERGSTFVFELPDRDLQTSLTKKPDVDISPVQLGKASLRSWKVSRASRTPSRPSSRASSRARSRASSRCETPTPIQELTAPVGGGGTMTTWMLSNGQELEKRKRQPYDAAKRRKVAENRGNACEKHRASKTACNPTECPQNKLYPKKAETARRQSITLASGKPYSQQLETIPQIADPDFAAMENQFPAEDAAFDINVFDDTMDSGTTIESCNESLSSHNHPSISNQSPGWSDGNYNDGTWSMTDARVPDLGSNEALCLIEGMEGVQGDLHHFGGDIMASDQLALPEFQPERAALGQSLDKIPSVSQEISKSIGTWPSEEYTDVQPQVSEDPFMGWASKRANHLFDDYGWVLSHVEAL